LLSYLMAAGPATASHCARAVGDTPSNCSYHLRVLAAHHLVEPGESGDRRTRPWKATITGFSTGADDADAEAGAARMIAASVELDHHLTREYLRGHESVPPRWRAVDSHSTFGLALSPEELADLIGRIDELVRPYIQATRTDAPADAEHVHLTVTAFPRLQFKPRP